MRCSSGRACRVLLRRAARCPAAAGSGGAALPVRPAGPDVHRPRGHLRLRGEERIFPLDLVPRILDEPDWRLVQTGSRSGSVPWRHSSPTSTARGTLCATASSPPLSSRAHRSSRGRCTGSCRRTGCACTSRGSTSSATKRASCVSWRTMCGARPESATSWPTGGHGADAPGALQRPAVEPVTEYPVRLLAALRAAAPADVDDPHRGRAHPGRLQLCFLRARAAGQADGRRAGRRA